MKKKTFFSIYFVLIIQFKYRYNIYREWQCKRYISTSEHRFDLCKYTKNKIRSKIIKDNSSIPLWDVTYFQKVYNNLEQINVTFILLSVIGVNCLFTIVPWVCCFNTRRNAIEYQYIMLYRWASNRHTNESSTK